MAVAHRQVQRTIDKPVDHVTQTTTTVGVCNKHPRNGEVPSPRREV